MALAAKSANNPQFVDSPHNEDFTRAMNRIESTLFRLGRTNMFAEEFGRRAVVPLRCVVVEGGYLKKTAESMIIKAASPAFGAPVVRLDCIPEGSVKLSSHQLVYEVTGSKDTSLFEITAQPIDETLLATSRVDPGALPALLHHDWRYLSDYSTVRRVIMKITMKLTPPWDQAAREVSLSRIGFARLPLVTRFRPNPTVLD